MEKLNRSWIRVLANQMHDILPGTSIPRAYTFSWNDEVVAGNGFTAVLSDSVGGISATIEITPDHLAESHSFKSQIDQSHLPYIIQGLESVLTRFPIRGTPS